MQLSILIGGYLKDYQLRWMVSLYNYRLNGILADEMVCAARYGMSAPMLGKSPAQTSLVQQQ
jgi:hypothetical protein